jgi:autotransporter-associated beta strand protein
VSCRCDYVSPSVFSFFFLLSNYAGTIAGTGNVVLKSGPANAPATLTLTGPQPNTCTGTTTVHAGRLALQKSAGVAAIAGPVIVMGGTLAVPVNDNRLNDQAVVDRRDVRRADHRRTIDVLARRGRAVG